MFNWEPVRACGIYALFTIISSPYELLYFVALTECMRVMCGMHFFSFVKEERGRKWRPIIIYHNLICELVLKESRATTTFFSRLGRS